LISSRSTVKPSETNQVKFGQLTQGGGVFPVSAFRLNGNLRINLRAPDTTFTQ